MDKIIFDTKVQFIKYKVLKEVARFSYEGTLLENMTLIPSIVSPGPESSLRCCIYKERAIVNERVNRAVGGLRPHENVISVINIACDECPSSGYEVTSDCRGCLAHRCKRACPRDAIRFDEKQRAIIDKSKCINCGLCAKACPYSAIKNRERPCMVACKVNAIGANPDGSAKIDDSKCIQCGQCVYQCPFGAITDRSSIVQIIESIKNPDNHVYAIVAPSIGSQFDYAKTNQVITGLKHLGFYKVIETALGADMVAYSETKELVEKGFLTSSCCPAFVAYIKKNFPEIADKVSHNPSPMIALGKFLKAQDDKAIVVFIGPCTAKKREALEDEENSVDYVMTFEELQAVFTGKNIDVSLLEETPLDNASYFGRIFARLGGLTEAVAEVIKENEIDFEVKPIICEGIDNIKPQLNRIKRGKVDFNFLEGMACMGGCIGGPCNINHQVKDKMDIDKYGKTSKIKTVKESLDNIKDKVK